MKYREPHEKTQAYKENYVTGLEALLQKKEHEAELHRVEFAGQIFEASEIYREALKKMLGWPLTEPRDSQPPRVIEEVLSQEDGYTVSRLQFTILEDVTISGLFFRLDGDEKKPLVIVQHGGDGTPEQISGVYGSTTYYHDMLQRVLEQGVHVFAPQLLLWNRLYQVPYDRKEIDTRLKRLGSSIAAIEIHAIMRMIDYFQHKDYVSTFGMVGLSYGGFYTLYTAALDTRILSSVSCAFFNQRKYYPFSDWSWFQSAGMFDDVEVACLVYPRRLCIEIGDKDSLFDCHYGVEAFQKLKAFAEPVGTDWVNLVVYDGIHEFCKEDAPLIQLAEDLKKNS